MERDKLKLLTFKLNRYEKHNQNKTNAKDI